MGIRQSGNDPANLEQALRDWCFDGTLVPPFHTTNNEVPIRP